MTRSKILLFFYCLFCLASVTSAKENIRFSYADFHGVISDAEGLLRLPKDKANKQAVVILHHAGGWFSGTTHQYGEVLEMSGFVTLEVRMFDQQPDHPQKHLAQAFGALQYLAKRAEVDPAQISIMGLSYGGAAAIYAATRWANDKYNLGGVKPKAIVAFYPTCFFHEGIATGESRIIRRLRGFGFPENFYSTWIRTPIRILIGGLDDYESRDPKACESFINSVPDEEQRKLISVKLFPTATHGWDREQTFVSYDPLACKWKGCINTNRSDKVVTEAAKADLIEFLK